MKILKIIMKGVGWIAVGLFTVAVSIILAVDYLIEESSIKSIISWK